MAGNAGGAVAGGIMMSAPTGITQVVGGYLVADGVYGVGSSTLDLVSALGWRNAALPENVNSLPRLAATLAAPNNDSAQRAADAFSLTSGLIGGRMITQPLMFSSRQIYATSNWSPAAQMGMSAYSVVQAVDAGTPAAEALKKEYDKK
jgi:hypothetical protein